MGEGYELFTNYNVFKRRAGYDKKNVNPEDIKGIDIYIETEDLFICQGSPKDSNLKLKSYGFARVEEEKESGWYSEECVERRKVR